MNLTVTTKSPFTQPASAVLLFAFENERIHLPASLRPLLAKLTPEEFRGADRQSYLLQTTAKAGIKPGRLLLVGLGPRNEFHLETLRRAAGNAAKRLRDLNLPRIALQPPTDVDDALPVIVESFILATYRFTEFKPAPKTGDLKTVTFCLDAGADLPAAKLAVQRAQTIADSANFTRSIANLPPNVIYPATLADRARQLADEFHLTCLTFNKAALEQDGFGGLLAVGGGSAREPHLIVLEYNGGNTGDAPVALVGKAITFDTGGISIKPAENMHDMKFDKCGGCAVLGILRAAAALKLPVNLLGVIAAAENMPSSTSYRPGDIVTSYRGTDERGVTIEILNTDAEGRIVLGDALTYARQRSPRAIIDFATLTGACRVALGDHAAGLFGNDLALVERLKQAGDDTGERCWPLPLWQEYRDSIKSDVADHKNTGGRNGGAITAAAFLERYVGKVSWAHFDICGVAWTNDERPYQPKGATGYGVRLILRALQTGL